ncbi:MAG TPA: type II secretion system protein [Mycobacterium sp.]|nr:type II secretion system protein [Mycobacterium sp.]
MIVRSGLAPRFDERGSTLLEALVTLVLMGIAFAALAGGLFTATVASSKHSQESAAETVLFAAAEQLKGFVYEAGCPYQAQLDPAPPPFQFAIRCEEDVAPPPQRLQRVTIEVGVGEEVLQTVEVVKRG